MTVGEKIKFIRNFRGMTQKELGVGIGFDERYIVADSKSFRRESVEFH